MDNLISAPVVYTPGFLTKEIADTMFVSLWNELAWKRVEGVPRREYWTNTFQRPYAYKNWQGMRSYEAQPAHPMIGFARALLAEEESGRCFEGCFLNGYEDSRDKLGWHSDDDPAIDHSRPIAILTLYDPSVKGHPRSIRFKEVIVRGSETQRWEFGKPESLVLEHGSLAVMLPGMQDTHQHEIPKVGFVSPPRISLTFRGLLP